MHQLPMRGQNKLVGSKSASNHNMEQEDGRMKETYIEDAQGNRTPWNCDEEWMLNWMKDHPPLYSWHVVLKNGLVYLCEYRLDKTVTVDSTEGFQYIVHCEKPGKVQKFLDNCNYQLKQTREWTRSDTRPGIGLTKETIDKLLIMWPPNNYGMDHTFNVDFITSNWGYGCNVEVSYKGPHYSDGKRFDTYANYDRHTVDEPSKRELIEFCDRIEISFNISMDRRSTPSKIIDRAVDLTKDKRLWEIFRSIMKEDL